MKKTIYLIMLSLAFSLLFSCGNNTNNAETSGEQNNEQENNKYGIIQDTFEPGWWAMPINIEGHIDAGHDRITYWNVIGTEYFFFPDKNGAATSYIEDFNIFYETGDKEHWSDKAIPEGRYYKENIAAQDWSEIMDNAAKNKIYWGDGWKSHDNEQKIAHYDELYGIFKDVTKFRYSFVKTEKAKLPEWSKERIENTSLLFDPDCYEYDTGNFEDSAYHKYYLYNKKIKLYLNSTEHDYKDLNVNDFKVYTKETNIDIDLSDSIFEWNLEKCENAPIETYVEYGEKKGYEVVGYEDRFEFELNLKTDGYVKIWIVNEKEGLSSNVIEIRRNYHPE